MNSKDCPICGSATQPLGTLGYRDWNRCRNCGHDSSYPSYDDIEDKCTPEQLAYIDRLSAEEHG